MRRFLGAAAAVIAVSTVVVSAATIKEIKLADGYDDENTLKAPVIDNSGRPGVEISVVAGFDRKAKFVRKTGSRFMASAEYDLDSKVDLGALLSEAFKAESTAMGFGQGATGTPWRVAATLTNAYMESRVVFGNATLFYGFLDLGLKIDDPQGGSQFKTLRVHSYTGGYSMGFARKAEAEGAVAHLLVEGAQEVLARLNRDYMKAPPHSSIAGRLAALRSAGAEKAQLDLRAVGLSGSPEATAVLIDMLPREQGEIYRALIINAIGVLGAPSAVTTLADRYAKEDEDPRYFTLKALDYIGGPEAAGKVSALGLQDEDSGPKRLAARILGTPVK